MVQTFGTNMCPHFRRDSSCTSRPCCHSPGIQVRCTGSRRCETSGIWILPSTRSTVCTGGWTHSHQSRPPCTCFLKGDKPEIMVRFRKWCQRCTKNIPNLTKVYFLAIRYGCAHQDCTFPANSWRTKTTVPTQLPELVPFGAREKFFCMQENPTHSGLLFTLVLILWPQVTARVCKHTWKTWPEPTGRENSIRAANKKFIRMLCICLGLKRKQTENDSPGSPEGGPPFSVLFHEVWREIWGEAQPWVS